MTVYALGDLVPDIHPEAFVHPEAVVIGAVVLQAQASVWPTAVLRGDAGKIVVGARTSVQDGTIVHCTAIHDTIIGEDCVVGHNAHIEGAVIGRNTLIASGSVVLNGAVVEAGSVVGAGAVVSPGTKIPARSLALGVPAKVREGHQVPEEHIRLNVAAYLHYSQQHREGLRRLS